LADSMRAPEAGEPGNYTVREAGPGRAEGGNAARDIGVTCFLMEG